MASSVPTSQTVPTTAVTTTPAMMARGTSFDGLTVSSARLPAVSKPYSTQAAVSMAARKGPT